LIQAKDRATLVAATHALDRALIWNHYVVPMWFVPNAWIAYWKRITFKAPLPGYGVAGSVSAHSPIWWFDDKAAAEISKS
jgi:microcin C transport system substrate-binding protein